MKPLAVYVIPMEKAEDMQRISSTRIRAGEVNEEGRLRKNQNGSLKRRTRSEGPMKSV